MHRRFSRRLLSGGFVASVTSLLSLRSGLAHLTGARSTFKNTSYDANDRNIATAGAIPEFDCLELANLWAKTAKLGSRVLVRGFLTEGDGGSFLGNVDSNSSSSNPGQGHIRPAASAVNPRMWGAVGDGISDDTLAFQNAIDFSYSEGGGRVEVDLPSSFYRTTKSIHMRPLVHLVGLGSQPEIRNEAQNSNWNSPVIVCGTYYSRASEGHVFAERRGGLVGELIEPSSYLSLPNSLRELKPGDLVLIHSLTQTGLHFSEAEINEVKDVVSDRVNLKYPLLVKHVGAESPVIWRRLGRFGHETGAVQGLDGADAYVLTDAVVENLKLTQANRALGYKAVHISAHNCEFRNLYMSGYSAFTGNPCSSCVFEDVHFDFERIGVELAYCTCRSYFRRIRGERITTLNEGSQFQFSFLFGSEDGGGSNTLEDAEFQDHSEVSSKQNIVSNFSAGDLMKNVSVFSSGKNGVGGISINTDSVGEGLFVSGCRETGIRLTGERAHVLSSTVVGVPAGDCGILFDSNAKDCVVSDCVVGRDGAPTSNDRICDNGIGGNRVINSSAQGYRRG